VSLEHLRRNAGVLPISEAGLRNVLDDIETNRSLDPEGFLDAARYGIRAVAALLPPERFNIVDLGREVGLDPSVTIGDLIEVVEARGYYEGEASASLTRSLIGLVDDGVRPWIAGRHLGIDEDEMEILANFLDLDRHWGRRILDRLHVILLDGGGPSEVRSTINVGRFTAWRLLRMARRTLPEGWSSGVS
jgi:hypothetical protein